MSVVGSSQGSYVVVEVVSRASHGAPVVVVEWAPVRANRHVSQDRVSVEGPEAARVALEWKVVGSVVTLVVARVVVQAQEAFETIALLHCRPRWGSSWRLPAGLSEKSTDWTFESHSVSYVRCVFCFVGQC